MKQDAKITHQENEMNLFSGTEDAMEEANFKGSNEASVNARTAGKEALRSMQLNTSDARKKSELTTGDGRSLEDFGERL